MGQEIRKHLGDIASLLGILALLLFVLHFGWAR